MKYYWEVDGWSLKEKVTGVDGAKKWLLNVIPDNESILDVGCGPGVVYEVFRKNGRNNSYLGCDIDPNYLDLSRTFFPDIQVEQADCFFLPYDDNWVDNVILFSVLDSVSDFRKPLEEALRVATKRVIITLFVPLIKESDYNAGGLHFPPEYVVRINEKKFKEYLILTKCNIKYGIIYDEDKPYYYWWILEK